MGDTNQEERSRAWGELEEDLARRFRQRFQRDPSARVGPNDLVDWARSPGRIDLGSMVAVTALQRAGHAQNRLVVPARGQAELLARLLRVEHELRIAHERGVAVSARGSASSSRRFEALPFGEEEGPGLSFVEALRRFPGAFWVPCWNRLAPDLMGWLDEDPPAPEFLGRDPQERPIGRAWDEFLGRVKGWDEAVETRIDRFWGDPKRLHGPRDGLAEPIDPVGLVTLDDLNHARDQGLIDAHDRADRLRLLLRLLQFERNARNAFADSFRLSDAEVIRRFPGGEGIALGLSLFRNQLPPPYRLTVPLDSLDPRNGQGGMAKVVRAEWWNAWPGTSPNPRIAPGFPLALKVSNPGEFTNQADDYEVPALAQLGDQVATPLLDRGWAAPSSPHQPERPFLVMPWIEGLDLDELIRLRSHGLKVETAVRIVFSAAAQIAEAHNRGVIHRDVKPANVRIRTAASRDQARRELPEEAAEGLLEESVVVMDFGIASHAGRRLSRVLTQAMGSLDYMAPEQLDPGHSPGPQADIFGLGVTLFQALTGRLPFKTHDPSTSSLGVMSDSDLYRRIRARQVVPLREVRSNVPEGLETLLLVCLQPDPRDRYRGVGELLDDLDRVMRGQPVRGRPPGRLTRWVRRVQERPGQFLAAFGSAAALMVALGVAVVFQARARANEQARRNAVVADRNVRYTVEQVLQITRDSPNRAEDLVGLFETIADDPQVTPEIQAWAMSHHARLELERGHVSNALDLFERVLEQRRQLVRANPEVRVDLAETLHDLAERRQAAQRLDEAEALYREALDLRQILVDESPDDPARLSDLARSRGYLGDLMVLRERWEEAQTDYEESFRIRETIQKANPDDPSHAFQLARAHRNFARLGLIGPQPDPSESSRRYEASWNLLQTWVADPAARARLVDALKNGLNPSQSVSEAREGLHPSLFLREAAVSLNGRGEALRRLQRRDEAARVHQNALDLLAQIDPARLAERDRLEQLRARIGLASASDDPAARVQHARDAYDLASRLLKLPDDPQTAPLSLVDDWTRLDQTQRTLHLLRLRARVLSDPTPSVWESARAAFRASAPPYDPEWRLQQPFWAENATPQPTHDP